MPSKSSFVSTFKSAIRRGTPCWTAVINISTKTGKTPTTIFRTLFTKGLVARQKFNGQWIYWPTFAKKSGTSFTKVSQYNLWQSFVDWCICSGFCTPRQFSSHKGSQPTFVNFFRKFWNLQFPGTTTSGFGSWSTPSFGFGGRSFGGFGSFGTSTGKTTKRRTTKRHSKRRVRKTRARRTTRTWGRARTTWTKSKTRRGARRMTRRTTGWTTKSRSWGRKSYTPSYKISRYRKTTARRYRHAA